VTAPLTDRPTHATTALVRSILEAHPEGLTDDRLWALTGLPGKDRGSVRRRRKDTGAVEVGKGKSDMGATCRIWALPEAES
jgi:hypothetical protein